MAEMIIRNLDKNIMEILKERAARHGRSMQKEVLQIITSAVLAEQKNKDAAGKLQKLQKKILAKRKGKIFSDSTRLIREDRDSHTNSLPIK